MNYYFAGSNIDSHCKLFIISYLLSRIKEGCSLNIKRILPLAAGAAAAFLFIRYALPLCAPFFAGALLALAAEPAVNFFEKRLRLPRGAAVGIGVSMTFFFLGAAVLLLCAIAVRELGGVIPDLEQTARSGIDRAHTLLLELSQHSPGTLRPILRENVDALFSDGAAMVDRGIGWSLSLAGNLLSHVPDSALSLGTGILSGYMISFRLPRFREALFRQEALKPLRAGWGRMKTAVAGWLRAQLRLMSMTALVLALGLTLLRIPYAALWAMGIAVVDALPVLGTGAVMIPWSILCFLQNDTPRAIGLLGTYVTAALLRSALEPKLLGRHMGLDPLVTLIALYAGYKLWGLAGMLLAPMLVVALTQVSPRRDINS